MVTRQIGKRTFQREGKHDPVSSNMKERDNSEKHQ